MNALPQRHFTVDEYLDWAVNQPGRYELHNGRVYAMSPEGVGHAKVKLAIHMALANAIRARSLPCHVLPDGVTVRVEAKTAYEPDAQVYCGQELEPSALEVPNPVIVVEVLSPSTRRIDTSTKVAGYFRLPSVAHYLIVDPAQPLVVHHTRGGEDIVTHIIRDGSISLDPPGLNLAMDDIYWMR